MLLSVAARVEPATVAEAMIEHVDIDDNPAWAGAVESALDRLDELDLYTRRTYLGFELPSPRTREWLKAAALDLTDRLGLSPGPVAEHEKARAAAYADQLGSRLSRYLSGIRPATADELLWLYERAPRRGINEPPPPSRDSGLYRRARLTAAAEALLDEGGKAGPDRRSWLRRQYLRVETPDGIGYQVFCVLSDLPRRFTLEGGEWFPSADAMSFPVDWCARIRPVDNRLAQTKVKRQRNELAGQLGQHDDDLSGLPPGLAEAITDVDDELTRLEANRAEPELHTTLIYAAWADNREEAEDRAHALTELFSVDDYALHRPTGGQRELFTAMLPAAPLTRPCRHYTQYFLAEDLAAGVPFAGTVLGDPYGQIAGFCLDTGTVQPVLLDLSYGPRTNRSGATALVGDLGAGKSYMLKSLVWATAARGGAAVLLDRTETGEYVRFAESLPGRVQVVHLGADSEVSLDPLRVFDGEERLRIAKGFLTVLLGADPRSGEGLAVGEATAKVASTWREPRLSEVAGELERLGASDPPAKLAGRQLSHLLTEDLARLVAGDQEPLRIGEDADAVVFHLPGLRLPDRVQLENEQLAKRLLPEQVLAQALLYLAVAVMRKIAFTNPSRFAVAGLDEVGFLTTSLEGQQLLYEFLRDSRKHGTSPLVGAQTIADLPEENLRGLITNRLLFRSESAPNARDGLEFLGVDPDSRNVDTVRRLDTGQCLLRDVDDRVGKVILVAPDDELEDAFNTTPDFSTGKRISASIDQHADHSPPGSKEHPEGE